MSILYEAMMDAKASGRKMLSVLVDPDRTPPEQCFRLAEIASEAGVSYFFTGSSILTTSRLDECIRALKGVGNIPVIIFPGDAMQVSPLADGILFLSLISGRNPEMLIGRQVLAAPHVKASGIEVIPTGYMLIDSGSPTSVSYMSYTMPIPRDKDDIAACTALAGEMLGLKMIYMDAGSGAKYPVSESMITSVRKTVSVPVIAGGGIRNAERAIAALQAGADMIVIGNGAEENPSLITDIAVAMRGIYTI